MDDPGKMYDRQLLELAWNTTVNYRIDAPLSFSGSFRQAVNDLFILYGTASTPLYAAT
ncbi:TcpQ domain-containing protein, partial [Salmonella enterica subsp. enterica serovar Bardo]|nr:TcpQ domain-containing protein [Salmonella enterica subsp. enterica serovar Bardo]